MTGEMMAYGPCWSCRRNFMFDPEWVPSIPIDPEVNLPPDLGGDAARAVRQPVCPSCMEMADRRREARSR